MVLSDGPAGVRGQLWDERYPSANLPCPTALAASWDEGLVERAAALLAAEARRLGVDVVLGPTANLHRSPLGGRHFECFSEDPLLSGRIGAAVVRALQAHGVAATPKHYVANDAEAERLRVDVRVDERSLRELYLAPFEQMVVEAGAWLVMAAYNSVNGATMTESPLLAEPLKGEWGFDGVVVSDWGAVRSTEDAANAGTDLAMPGPQSTWGEALVAAVRAGQVPEATIDEKVRRILRLAARVGALAGAMPPAITPPAPPSGARVAALTREAAGAGMVLVRNHGDALPLDPAILGRVAVLGPNAATGRTQGGGSVTVQPAYTVSPLEGMRRALGPDVEVRHAPGGNPSGVATPLTAGQVRHPDSHRPGLAIRFLDATGAVLREEHRAAGAVMLFGDGILAEAAAVRLRGRFRATKAGAWRIGMTGVGACTLELDGQTVLDEHLRAESADLAASFLSPPHRAVTRQLVEGQEVLLAMTWRRTAGGPARLAVTAEPPAGSDDEQIEQAVALARRSDAAIVVVGTSEEDEREGFDRHSIALPGRQDDLVRAVAAVNPRTIVVVNAGAPVAMPWRDRVAAVLLTWFPGQEFGNALADVLLGTAEPGGRLPTTWAAEERDVPVLSTRPTEGVLAYTEGIHIGYRAWLRAGAGPAYPFGHGLGYTTWVYVTLDALRRHRPAPSCGSGSTCATAAPGAAKRSSRPTWTAPTPRWSGRPAGSPGSPWPPRRPGRRSPPSFASRRAPSSTGASGTTPGMPKPGGSGCAWAGRLPICASPSPSRSPPHPCHTQVRGLAPTMDEGGPMSGRDCTQRGDRRGRHPISTRRRRGGAPQRRRPVRRT
jgi:beta-glucosidase